MHMYMHLHVSHYNWLDANWTIAPPVIKIQDKKKKRLVSVHFIWDRKHVYLFALGCFQRYAILTGQSNLSINFLVRLINSHIMCWSSVTEQIYCLNFQYLLILKKYSVKRNLVIRDQER